MEELETPTPEPAEENAAASPPDEPAGPVPEQEAVNAEQAPEGAATGEEPPRETPVEAESDAAPADEQPVSAEELLAEAPADAPQVSPEDVQLKAVLEAIVYVTDEPLTLAQIAGALGEPQDRVDRLLNELMTECERPERGVTIREVAGGYKMTTKAEHHDAVRNFVKSLKPPLKLSLAALETLAVIAYKQPVTSPEIMEIRGVQGAGVLKTLLDRKLIAVAGRKNVIGKPMLYKTTKEFLIQFGLKDLAELPTLKEFEEIGRLALSDSEPAAEAEPAATETAEAPAETELAQPETEAAAPEPAAEPESAPEPENPPAEPAPDAPPEEPQQ